MATVTKTVARYHDQAGIRLRKVFQYAGPASYATGGDSLTAAELGLGKIEAVNCVGAAWNGSAARILVYDYANSKMVWYVPNTGAEVGAATDLSLYTVRLEVLGR